MVYSVANPITLGLLLEKMAALPEGMGLCRGAYGVQTDLQCLGYDHLCGLAVLFYARGERDASYLAVERARQEVIASPYSRGFAEGWDGKPLSAISFEQRTEYMQGRQAGEMMSQWGEFTTCKFGGGCYSR